MSTFTSTLNRNEIQRFLRFLVVGLSGTILDFGLLIGLKWLGMGTLLAATLSFSAGVINNFTWNYYWTYADAQGERLGLQLGQFALVSALGLGINNLCVLSLESLSTAWMPDPSLAYLPAKIVATGVVVFWNYFANRYWTFNNKFTTKTQSSQSFS